MKSIDTFTTGCAMRHIGHTGLGNRIQPGHRMSLILGIGLINFKTNLDVYCPLDPMDLSIFEQKIYSQNGEDGVTMKLLDLIYDDPTHKNYVEFGVEDGKECNTRILREKYKWSGLQMDGSHENRRIQLRNEFITKENIVDLFKKYKVPPHIHLLSVDIDFNDFYCLKEILDHHQCDIIICEYNATHLSHEDKIVVYDPHGQWDKSNYFGASLLALDKLAKIYNYSLIYCNQNGVNSFFIHNDILKKKGLHFKDIGDVMRLYKPARYGDGPNGGHPQDPYHRPYLSFEQAIM